MANPKLVKKIRFGYGIVDKKGKPFWDEDCVCQDRGTLEMEVVPGLNEMDEIADPEIYARQPFRVVALYRLGRN
jgi:hypothetical protein